MSPILDILSPIVETLSANVEMLSPIGEILSPFLETLSADVEMLSPIEEILSLFFGKYCLLFGKYCLLFGRYCLLILERHYLPNEENSSYCTSTPVWRQFFICAGSLRRHRGGGGGEGGKLRVAVAIDRSMDVLCSVGRPGTQSNTCV